MLCALLLAATGTFPIVAQSSSDQLHALADTIRSVCIAYGCDQELFASWDVRSARNIEPGGQSVHIGGSANLSLRAWGALEFFFSPRPSASRNLSDEEQQNLWTLGECAPLADDLVRQLRPTPLWVRVQAEYSPSRGIAEFTYVARHGTFPYRHLAENVSVVEVDAMDGRPYSMSLLPTPQVRPENAQLAASEPLLRQRTIDAYASYRPYFEGCLVYAELCMISPKSLLLCPGIITDRHRNVAAAGEGMLVFQIVVQRLRQGQPTRDFRFVYLDASTGVPLATWEMPLEYVTRRGAEKVEPTPPTFLKTPVRVQGCNEAFTQLSPATCEATTWPEQILLESEDRHLILAEVDPERTMLRIGGPMGECLRLPTDFVSVVVAALDRRNRQPPFLEPTSRVAKHEASVRSSQAGARS